MFLKRQVFWFSKVKFFKFQNKTFSNFPGCDFSLWTCKFGHNLIEWTKFGCDSWHTKSHWISPRDPNRAMKIKSSKKTTAVTMVIIPVAKVWSRSLIWAGIKLFVSMKFTKMFAAQAVKIIPPMRLKNAMTFHEIVGMLKRC